MGKKQLAYNRTAYLCIVLLLAITDWIFEFQDGRCKGSEISEWKSTFTICNWFIWILRQRQNDESLKGYKYSRLPNKHRPTLIGPVFLIFSSPHIFCILTIKVWVKKSRETLCLMTQKWLILESKLKLNVKTILQEL